MFICKHCNESKRSGNMVVTTVRERVISRGTEIAVEERWCHDCIAHAGQFEPEVIKRPVPIPTTPEIEAEAA